MFCDLQVNLGLKWADLSTVHGRFKTMVIPVPDNLQARALLIYIARQKLFHALVFLMMKKEISLPTCGSTTNVYTVIDEWNKSTDNRQTFRVLGSFYGQFDFGKIWAPLEGLSYKISFGPDFRHYRQGIFISKDSAVKMAQKTMLNMQQIVTCHGHWIIRSTITRHSANIT